MPDDTYWSNTRADLLLLVKRLQPDDALAIIRELIDEETGEQIVPTLAGLIRGYVARRDDEQQQTEEAL